MGLAVLALLAFALDAAAADPIAGSKPGYALTEPGSIANKDAIGRRIWMPGLDEGFVPQGLAVADGHILVSAYQSADPKVSSGPCRVFRVEAATGKTAGSFDMPPACRHSGGLAYAGDGVLVVSDTRQLWRIDLARALASGKAEGAIRGTVLLGGDLHGSFASFDGTDLWIGRYTVQREADKAKLHRVPMKVFDEFDGRTITEAQVLETLPSPPLGQGMAFQGKDAIWIASSSSQLGWLHRLDRATGQVAARYDVVIGLEGIAFDAAGKLWAVSEAGARKWLHWKQHFPVIFEMDTSRLK